MFITTIFIGSNQTDNGNEFCSFTMPSGYQVISSLLMTIFFLFKCGLQNKTIPTHREKVLKIHFLLSAKVDKQPNLQHRVRYSFGRVKLFAFSAAQLKAPWDWTQKAEFTRGRGREGKKEGKRNKRRKKRRKKKALHGQSHSAE